jgi:Putative peptidoglycan binding domain
VHLANGAWNVVGGAYLICFSPGTDAPMPSLVAHFFVSPCRFGNGDPLPSPFHAEPSKQPFSQGDAGSTVWQLQVAVNDHGVGIDPDGFYGAATVAAVKAFQQTQRLPVTGVVDTATLTALGVKL